MAVGEKFMFAILLAVMLCLCGSSPHKCWFKSKTRSGEECVGKMRRFSEGMTRHFNAETEAAACTRHWVRASRQCENFCACPLTDHSQQLHSQRIPTGLYALFDRVGSQQTGYRPGVRWCRRCAIVADDSFQNEPDYVPPQKVCTLLLKQSEKKNCGKGVLCPSCTHLHTLGDYHSYGIITL